MTLTLPCRHPYTISRALSPLLPLNSSLARPSILCPPPLTPRPPHASLASPSGTGKSEFINAMLERPAARTNAFSDATKSIRVIKGSYRGIQVWTGVDGWSRARTAESRCGRVWMGGQGHVLRI